MTIREIDSRLPELAGPETGELTYQGVLIGAWKQVLGWIESNRPILPF